MSKLCLVLSIAVLAIATGAMAAPATPAALPAPGVDSFLSSLGSPAPAPAAARGLQTKQTCTVTLDCHVGPGYQLSCTSGSGNCSSTATSVTCDGATQNCPVCYVSVDCCGDGTILDCFGFSSCSHGARRVTCDGFTDFCGPIRQCGF